LIAGQVIATEAGAIVTNFSGDTVTPQQVLATQPGVQKALIRFIADSTKA
jgi:fructose-1,6-bisphosphatase/inositol monophosphatase family enzyme